MEIVSGIAASPGLGIAPALIYSDRKTSVPQYTVAPEMLAAELARFTEAKAKVRADLLQLKQEKSIPDKMLFIDAHLLMLDDPLLNDQVEQRVQHNQQNIEFVLFEVVGELVDLLGRNPNKKFQERSIDLSDLAHRVLDHLAQRRRATLAHLDQAVIVVAHDLYPTDTLGMNREFVLGIATDLGGTTSHSSILARSFNIPAVVGLQHNFSHTLTNGTMLIIDGYEGKIYLDPDPDTLALFRNKQLQQNRHRSRLLSLNLLPAVTRDGKLITLKGNIELPEEVDLVEKHHADGIGLFRSEFLFLSGYSPSEEEQYNIFSQVVKRMGEREVTIRTLDLGGDKSNTSEFMQEGNPLLGWRAIRFCLSRPEMFRSHLRAILRASVHGRVRLMLPMISGHRELLNVKEFLEGVKAELRTSGVPFDENIPLGAMIEVPGAAMASDLLAKEVDFFSIGTNDLIQYALAVDRNNSRVAYLHDPFHLGVIRLIKITIDNAHQAGIPVAMCGEMASDLTAAPLLIGLGLDELSMTPVLIPQIRQIIRTIDFIEAEEFASQMMEVSNFAEMERILQEWQKQLPTQLLD